MASYSEDLLKNVKYENNIKLLTSKTNSKKYLKGMQIVLDQNIRDIVDKEYKNESAYTIDKDGQTIIFYEIPLEEYVIPPGESNSEDVIDILPSKISKSSEKMAKTNDMYSFKVFDISAKCKFLKTTFSGLLDNINNSKIISIRSESDLEVSSAKIIDYLSSNEKSVLHAVCTEENLYRSWGLFEQLLREYFKLPQNNALLNPNFDAKPFTSLYNFLLGKIKKTSTSEDARFAYMEDFGRFLASLKGYTIVIEGFENIDDSSVQALSLYFDKFKKIVPDFIFVTNSSVHAKFKELLQTNVYKELTLFPSTMDEILSDLKADAGDFIQSFYFEKIKENFEGSKLYFDNAIKFLTEKNVLVEFDNKLLLRSNASVILPASLKELLKARLKLFGSKYQEASLIIAFSCYLGFRLDFDTLRILGIQDIEESTKAIEKAGFGYVKDKVLYINNYNILKPVMQSSIKKDTETFLCKTILSKSGKGLDNTTMLILLGCLDITKEEYLILWKNAQFAMETGDYDAYLKNCFGFLSIIDKIDSNITKEEVENHKKEIFQNILMSLYSYSPEKIYSIENVLLMDAMKESDDEKIVKLSNLMLQGALISSNYTDAVSLMHNILTRMKNPSLVTDNKINTKFLLLSLVNIEILFNIGDFYNCIEIAEDMLKYISKDILGSITPKGFSTNLFVTHMMETFRLAAFAKIIVLNNDLDEFLEKIKNTFEEELPDKESIVCIRDFLAGKTYVPSGTENATPFSKAVLLLLEQFSEKRTDYKEFAQNCYQAKLLASDLHQSQIERFCDILIAYAYANIGIKQKAEAIYKDVIEKAEKSAIFNSLILSKYFMAKLKISNHEYEEATLLINDALSLIQKDDNQAKIFYALLEKLFIEVAENNSSLKIDISSEKQKLLQIAPNGELKRIIDIEDEEENYVENII